MSLSISMKRLFVLLFFSGLMVTIGCGDDRYCTDIWQSPIVVRVIDVETKTPICDASVLVEDGAGQSKEFNIYHDRIEKNCTYAMEDEYRIDLAHGAGTVRVTVVRSGYRTATQVVQMVQGECGLVEQKVHFELVPE